VSWWATDRRVTRKAVSPAVRGARRGLGAAETLDSNALRSLIELAPAFGTRLLNGQPSAV
jgi:hypothetical protein